ncbi:hypothetical protein VH79_24400 [Salmonella enterica]|uniref:Uncharacterized protein n=1 Tax=Salmonella enterica TaxID=28901 RepID=A0A5U3ILI7_SALER|nr:hypothetical protein [Salmonella enterica]
MARSKAPRKRRPGKHGKSSFSPDTLDLRYPKLWLVSVPPESDDEDAVEFFYDTPEEAIDYYVRFGPQFFLDTQPEVPEVYIIRGFEQYSGSEAQSYENVRQVHFLTTTGLRRNPGNFQPAIS